MVILRSMADFCRQCSLEIFDHDHGDMANITTEKSQAKDLYALVLCEGCGPIQVDHKGNCISLDCFKSHGKEQTDN